MLIINILVHEIIHGLGWALFSKKSIRNIVVGFDKSKLLFYCHFKEPIPLKFYIIGVLAPFILLGFFPLVYSLFYNSLPFYLFASINILFCAGDLLVFNKAIKIPAHALVKDSLETVGFDVVS